MHDIATRKGTMKNYGWGRLLGSAVKGNALLRRLSCWLMAMGLVLAHASNAYAWFDRTALQSGTGGWIYGGAYAGSGQGNAFSRAGSTKPPTPLNQYDDAYINIRFPTSWHGGKGFPYYGEFYSWMQVHTNGYVVLKKALSLKPASEPWDTPIVGSDFSPKRITRSGGSNLPSGIIAPWWSDWDPSSTTALIMAERNCWWFGTCTNSANDAQPYIVEWRDIYHYGGNSRYSFGIRLYPVSGKIEFQYGNVIGSDQWSGGNLSTAGYLRDSATVGDEVFFNGVLAGGGWGGPNMLTSNTVIQYTPPQFHTIYAHTRDFMNYERRGGVFLDLEFRCSDYRGGVSKSTMVTDANGAARFTAPNTNCYSYNSTWNYDNTRTQLGSKTDIYGNDIAQQPGATPTVIAQNIKAGVNIGGGPYTFILHDKLTPAPRYTDWFWMDYTLNRFGTPLNTTGGTNGMFGASCWPQYGQGNQAYSRLVWYGKATTSSKTLIIVPGMDALNTSSPAAYLAAFHTVLRGLVNEGYMLAFGDYGSPSVNPRCLTDEVALWIDRAHSNSGNKVSVAGVSMGGIVIRNLIALLEPWNYYYNDVYNKIRAWYSIDSPHKGANIGGSETSETNSVVGMQTLLVCERWGSDNFNMIMSENVAAMNYHSWTSASCDPYWPDEHRTAMSTWWHDNYYDNMTGQPTLVIPAYAIAQGDGWTSSPTYTRAGFGMLFHFDYLDYVLADMRWQSYKFDWFPGSTYISQADVHTDDTFGSLNLSWKPSFINVHSALNGSYMDTNNDGNYDQLAPGPWTAFVGNDSNWPHCVLSENNACMLRNWVRREHGDTFVETCPGPPTSVPPLVQDIVCSTMLNGG